MIYVDRGYVHQPDFTAFTLTLDSSWHELDLSDIVPPEAAGKLIHLKAKLSGLPPVHLFIFRTIGDGENNIELTIHSEDQPNTIDALTVCNAQRKIEYMGVADPTILDLTVRGWLI